MNATNHIAVDLGAESGRVMLGRVGGGAIELEELHRFPEHRRVGDDGLERWDIAAIGREIEHGVRVGLNAGGPIHSVSVDSWGVDYVRLIGEGKAVGDPLMYRAAPTKKAFQHVVRHAGRRRRMYEATGVQFLPFNSIFQWIAEGRAFGYRDNLLLMADYFNWRLTGGPLEAARQEVSLASTTQAYDPRRRAWSGALLGEYGILPFQIPLIVPAGTVLGTLRSPEVAPAGTSVRVVATCSHDTAAAVAATPLADGAAYLSSGTWSLLGVESAEPVITDAAREANFTNEVGYGHSIRLLKNLGGLFILQECRKEFDGDAEYAALAAAAGEAEPLRSLIRPDAAPFGEPGGMTNKIADFCRNSNQPVPETPGQIARCVYDSLALLYAETLGQIEAITGRRPTRVNVVGGGSRAAVLNQAAADACGVPVEAGPVEATALGNVGVQAIAAGTLGGLDDLRDLVRRSFPLTTYQPNDGRYPAAAERFSTLDRS